MEAGAQDLVGDQHLGPELDEAVHSPRLGGTDVGGGEDPYPHAAGDRLDKGVLHELEAAPLEEGAQEVDLIGRGDLGRHLVGQARLAPVVHQQIGAT